ncbi:MAG: beta-lactamase family protein [Kordiimonadaceae bacterium]|nr:beta-lactamase family protein [Kordiimonadaceae bacterium]MBO6567401.1 beta-lactamase family protein [Kordiimonadaceae bacterium]MBO6963385.1 beta-lactamase family protein [Kordiimonadaceae bacterium]
MKSIVRVLALVSLMSPAALAADEAAITELQQRMQSEGTSNLLFLNDADRRVAFAHMDRFAPSRALPASGTPYPLATELDASLMGVTYSVDGQNFTVESLLGQEPLMGMAVLQGDTIRLEHYAPDHTPESTWVSFSVTKSFTSTLIGAALKDGYITSLDDTVETYLPRLRGTDYGSVKVRHILQMASGIAWNENYEDPESDVAQAGAHQGVALTDYISKLKRAHPAGEVFNYNTAESNLAGEILRAAIGNNAATYMNDKIWQAFGMEHDATWLLAAPNGQETGGCCISASLRDYARMGLVAKKGGMLPSGESILPEGWMDMATTPSKGFDGYGYKWWLLQDGAYTASGIFGQMIFIDPKRDLVIAVHSNAPAAVGTDYHKHYRAAAAAIVGHFAAR